MRSGGVAGRIPVVRPPGRGDIRWFLIWVGGMALLWLWDVLFLNRPALLQIQEAVWNTLLGAVLVVIFTLLLGWASALSLYFLESRRQRFPYLSLSFLLNLIRSVPQIVGILVGYVLLTVFIEREIILSSGLHILWMAFVISLFVFLELSDVIRERIDFFRKSDFFDAMLCCGVRESRIINVDILWKNSLSHILHKLIATFGMAIFLQCSIDFIISVGLSTDVSLANFPRTLGSLLANLDSKQDILAISSVFTDITYVGRLLTTHLQGVSIASIIVFTLVCVYKITNGFVKRNRL
jgi:ABC-type amino acid transport system permease subunit